MPTIETGRLIRQSNGRVWRIEGPAPMDRTGRRRWVMLLQEVPPGDYARVPGETSVTTEEWINVHCVDLETAIAPPCGDGPQVARVISPDGTILDERFVEAEDACLWLDDNLYPEQVGHWFGWDCCDLDATPDLICHSVEGKLVWSEP